MSDDGAKTRSPRARNGSGWLIKPLTKGGPWRCGFRYRSKRYRWTSHSPLKQDAIAALATGISQIRAGTFQTATEARRARAAEREAELARAAAEITVSTLAERWLEHAAKITRDAKGYGIARTRVAHYFSLFFGKKDASLLTTDDLMAYRGWLAGQKMRRTQKDGTVLQTERPLTVQTQRHILSDCRALILWAEGRGLVPRGTVPKKKLLPPPQEKPLRSMTADQQATVRSVAEPFGFAVRLMIDSGARWSELCRLTSGDLQDGELLIHGPTKSGRMRRVPLPPALVAEIKGHVGKLVPYEAKDVSSFNRAVRARTDVAAFSAHACRHSYGFNYMTLGGNLLALKEQMGHSTVELTAHYARPTQAMIREDAAKVERARVERVG